MAGITTELSKRKYMHWENAGVEQIPPNEAEDVQAVADMINANQKNLYNQHRHCYTGAMTFKRNHIGRYG